PVALLGTVFGLVNFACAIALAVRTLGPLVNRQGFPLRKSGAVHLRLNIQSPSINKRYLSWQISSPSKSAFSPTRRHVSATRLFALQFAPRSASSATWLRLATRLVLSFSCARLPAHWTSPYPRASSTAIMRLTRSPVWLPLSTR